MLRKQGNARNARQREGACRMASGNASLGSAKKAKNDEFYTQYADIESEMNAYYEYDKDVFRGKTVLCPCDDPEWSNFTKYFASNFERFGLRKLICTSYAKGAGNGQITLFEKSSPLFDEGKHESHGKLYVLIGDRDGSGRVDQDDIEFSGYLEGDGDFRSAEVTELLQEADVVATNLDHGRRHEPLMLDTMEHNLKFNKKLKKKLEGSYGKAEYPEYDNYDAIEVPYVEAIPSDYDGVMGVPITFLDKYNPEQFEIVGITKTWYGAASKTYPTQLQVGKTGKQTSVKKLNDGPAIKLKTAPIGETYYLIDNEPYLQTYARVLVKSKKAQG